MERKESVGGAPPPDLSGAIQQIMAHPELISMVASALGVGNTSPPSASATSPSQASERDIPSESEEPPSTVPSAVPPAVPPADSDSPAVPSDASLAATAPSESSSKGMDMGNAIAAIAPLISAWNGSAAPRADDHRACLLRALKPYVSPGRRDAIDYMIRLSQISDVLKQLH